MAKTKKAVQVWNQVSQLEGESQMIAFPEHNTPQTASIDEFPKLPSKPSHPLASATITNKNSTAYSPSARITSSNNSFSSSTCSTKSLKSGHKPLFVPPHKRPVSTESNSKLSSTSSPVSESTNTYVPPHPRPIPLETSSKVSGILPRVSEPTSDFIAPHVHPVTIETRASSKGVLLPETSPVGVYIAPHLRWKYQAPSSNFDDESVPAPGPAESYIAPHRRWKQQDSGSGASNCAQVTELDEKSTLASDRNTAGASNGAGSSREVQSKRSMGAWSQKPRIKNLGTTVTHMATKEPTAETAFINGEVNWAFWGIRPPKHDSNGTYIWAEASGKWVMLPPPLPEDMPEEVHVRKQYITSGRFTIRPGYKFALETKNKLVLNQAGGTSLYAVRQGKKIRKGGSIFYLPTEILAEILSLTSPNDIDSLAATSQLAFDHVSKTVSVWDISSRNTGISEQRTVLFRKASNIVVTSLVPNSTSYGETFTDPQADQPMKRRDEYDAQDTTMMQRMVVSFGEMPLSITHLEFRAVPLLTVHYLRQLIPLMANLKYLTIHSCPLINLTDLRHLFEVVQQRVRITKMKRDPPLLLDFRPPVHVSIWNDACEAKGIVPMLFRFLGDKEFKDTAMVKHLTSPGTYFYWWVSQQVWIKGDEWIFDHFTRGTKGMNKRVVDLLARGEAKKSGDFREFFKCGWCDTELLGVMYSKAQRKASKNDGLGRCYGCVLEQSYEEDEQLREEDAHLAYMNALANNWLLLADETAFEEVPYVFWPRLKKSLAAVGMSYDGSVFDLPAKPQGESIRPYDRNQNIKMTASGFIKVKKGHAIGYQINPRKGKW